MAITFVGSDEHLYNSGTPVTSRTINVATGTRTNGLIGVLVQVINGGDVTSVTWGGATLTKREQTSDTAPFSDIWYRLDPAGGTDDVVVNFSGNTFQFHVVVFWVDSDSTLVAGAASTNLGTSDDPITLNVTAAGAGDLIISSYATKDNNTATNTTGTLIHDEDLGGNCSGASYLIAGGAGAQAMTWDRSPAGQDSTHFHIVGTAFAESVSNEPPTIALNTADLTTFNTGEVPLEATGTDPNADDVRYNPQISEDSGFTHAHGSNLADNYYDTDGLRVHPNPHTSASTWQGEIQVDDRPGQSFEAEGGILDKIVLNFQCDAGDTMDGQLLVRVYAHTGTYGTSSAPTNAALPADTPTPNWLAESDPNTFSGIVGLYNPSTAEMTFTFSGNNRIRLEAGIHYVWIADWLPDNRNSNNTPNFYGEALSAAHGGNAYLDSYAEPNNGPHSDWDFWFEVYETFTLLDKVSGTDAGFENVTTPADTDPFNSSDQIRFTIQAGDALTDHTWYWRMRGIDPAGSGVYGAWSEVRSFTVITGLLISLVTETDQAQPITATKIRTLGQATETSQAQPITATSQIVVTLNQIVDTHTAQTITSIKRLLLNQPEESSSAQALTASKIKNVGQATTTQQAQLIQASKQQAITQPEELDSAQPITASKIKLVGQVSDTQQAQPVQASKQKTLAQALESNLAHSIATTGTITETVIQTTETEIAQPLASSKTKVLNQAQESSVAQPIASTSTIIVVLTQAIETSTPQSITPSKIKILAIITETQSALGITTAKQHLISQAADAGIAQTLVTVKSLTINRAEETEAPLPIAWSPKHRRVTQVNELNEALAIVATNLLATGYVTVTFTAKKATVTAEAKKASVNFTAQS